MIFLRKKNIQPFSGGPICAAIFSKNFCEDLEIINKVCRGWRIGNPSKSRSAVCCGNIAIIPGQLPVIGARNIII